MDSNKKRTVLMIGGIIVIVALIGVVYYFLFGQKPAAPGKDREGEFPVSEPGEEIIPGPGEETGARRQIYTIINKPVIAPFLTSDGKILYFSKEDENLREADINGQNDKALFPTTTYPNLISAKWNLDGSAALITTADITGTKKQWTIFSRSDNADYQINQADERIGPAALAPFENRYLYQFRDEQINVGSLSIADYDGKNWENVIKSGLIELNLDWPEKNKVSFYHLTSGLAESNFFAYDMQTNTLKKLLSAAFGLLVKWDPTGSNFIFSTTNQNGGDLSLDLGDGTGVIKKLTIDGQPVAAFPEKCVFSLTEPVFYCAVIQNVSAGTVFPDDYYKGIADSKDTLYKFFIETGRSIKIPGLDSAPNGFNVEKILMSEDNRYIFFVNKRDGYLYRMDMAMNP